MALGTKDTSCETAAPELANNGLTHLDIVETRLGYPTSEAFLGGEGDEEEGLVCEEGKLGYLGEHGECGGEREERGERGDGG